MLSLSPLDESEIQSFFPKRKLEEDTEFDITPMIDLVFMMNIYFLVTAVVSTGAEIDLPKANHVSALDGDTAVVITVVAGVDGRTVQVYLGDGAKGAPITDPADQEARIAEYIEQAQAAGKRAVLIKAEQRVSLREIGRIAGAATLDGMSLHLGVTEKDTNP